MLCASPRGPLGNSAPLVLRFAVANGLGNAKKLLDAVREGSCPYDFVEVSPFGQKHEWHSSRIVFTKE